jgi:hypothetical protein
MENVKTRLKRIEMEMENRKKRQEINLVKPELEYLREFFPDNCQNASEGQDINNKEERESHEDSTGRERE